MSQPILKPTRKPITNKPQGGDVPVMFKVTRDEEQAIWAKAKAYTNGNRSEYLRFAALNFEPKKGDFQK